MPEHFTFTHLDAEGLILASGDTVDYTMGISPYRTTWITHDATPRKTPLQEFVERVWSDHDPSDLGPID